MSKKNWIKDIYVKKLLVKRILKLQSKSLDKKLTLFYPCHKKKKKKNNNKKKKKKKNPHQNLS